MSEIEQSDVAAGICECAECPDGRNYEGRRATKARAATAPRKRGAELRDNRQARPLLAGTFLRDTGLRTVLGRGPGAQRWESWQQRQLKHRKPPSPIRRPSTRSVSRR